MNIYEEVLLPAVNEYNQTFDQGGQIQTSKELPLSGQGGALDSLELINFIIIVERRVNAASGRGLQLVTGEALSRGESPFSTLESLEKFIREILDPVG